MGKLVETFAFGGSRLADGTPNASGKVWIYIQNTTSLAPVFADVFSDSIITQPIVLDAAGRAIFYVDQVCTIHVETAAGATVNDYNLADSPGVVQVETPFYTGTLPDGSQGPGGVTDLQKILTSAGVSFGGPDFTYIAAPGTTPRSVSDWMREVHLSVKDFGAVGDGHSDDTTAIQATVNRCVALGGGTVYFPPGTYNITATILVPASQSISFVGAGYVSTIANQSAVSGIFSISTSRGFQISQLSLVGAPTGTTAPAIVVKSSQFFSILDCAIQLHSVGIDLSQSVGSASHVTFQVARCYIGTTSAAGARAIKTSGALYVSSISACVLIGNNSEPDLELLGNVSSAAFDGSVNVTGCYILYGVRLTSVVTGTAGVVSLHGNAFGNNGVSTQRISVTGTAPRISNVGNNVEGFAYTMPGTGTITPDLTNGRVLRINSTSAAASTITIAPPTPLGMILRSAQLHFSLINTGAGPTTWQFSAAAGGFHLAPAVAFSGVAGKRTELIVEYDPDSNYWAELGRTEINL